MATNAENLNSPIYIEFDPEQLLTDDNVRYGLKPGRIDSLAEEIRREGRINQNIGVVALDEPVDGKTHRVTFGNYRVAAALKLNQEGAGIKVPALVMEPMDAVTLLTQQISENVQRESMSPMDVAYSIDRLKNAGMPVPEIRRVFATPGMGRKGKAAKGENTGPQAASNSYINIHLSFLKFPKQVQDDIHNGRITVGGAYELSRHPRENWDSILDRIQRDKENEDKRLAKDEEKYLLQAKKEEEVQVKAKAAEDAVKAAEDQVEQARLEAEKASEAEVEALKAARAIQSDKKATKEAKDEATKLFNEAKVKHDQAMKSVAAAEKVKEKQEDKKAEYDAKVAERAKQLKAARDAAPAKKAVGQANVKKAAAGVGSTAKGEEGPSAKLNANDMRRIIDEWALPGSFPKVQAIAGIIKKVFNMQIQQGKAYTELAKITGEKK